MTTSEMLVINKGSGHMCTGRCACRAGSGAAQAAASPTDLTAAMKSLWDKLLKLGLAVDGLAARQGKRFVEASYEPAGPLFADPTPWGTQANTDAFPDAKSPDGNPHGDERLERRRRATQLERQIMIARKKRNGASIPDKVYWDRELARLSAELEAIRDAERRERDAVRTPPEPLGPSVTRD